MKNLVLITSIIKPPKTPLSYGIRSIYTNEERFNQTKNTIKSIKEKIENCEIFIVECSDLDDNEKNYFVDNSTYFLNLYDNIPLRNKMHSPSKSLCEGTMTICALDFLINNTIEFDNLIKISGRYFLSENFNFDNFKNDNIVIKYINNDMNNVFTGLYKLTFKFIEQYRSFLNSNIHNMEKCIGFENLFAQFIKTIPEKVQSHKIIGLAGNVSVSTDFYNG